MQLIRGLKEINFVTQIPSYSLIITDERIAELINQYDANGAVNIKKLKS